MKICNILFLTCCLYHYCLSQSFEGEIKFLTIDSKGDTDTTVNTYGKNKIKSGCNKWIWQYGYHVAYYDFEKYPLNTWYLYNRDENSIFLQEEQNFADYEVIKLDSTASILGYPCQIYDVIMPPKFIYNSLIQEIRRFYFTNIQYDVPKDWVILPPAYNITNTIALMTERIVLKDGKEYARIITRAISVSPKHIEDSLLVPPDHVVIKVERN